MAYRTWQIDEIKYCEHVGHEVALEAEVVYPAEHLPDQPPRIIAQRCSNAVACNMFDKAVCKNFSQKAFCLRNQSIAQAS